MRDLDGLLRDAQPALARVLGSPALDQGERDLLEEIMSTPVTPLPHDIEAVEITPTSPRPAHRRGTIAVAAAAALVAVIAGPALLFRDGGSPDVVPAAPPAAVKKVADENPHLLMADPAWKLTYVVDGEMQWLNGKRQLQVDWYRADARQGYVDDRTQDGGKPPTTIRVRGQEVTLFTYGNGGFEALFPADGNTFVMVGGDAGADSRIAALLDELRPVPPAAWEAAMPAQVVTPAEAAGVADEMLADIPQPPGYDPATIPHDLTMNRYDFGAAVVGSVGCAWFKLYETARTTGDEAGVKQAQAALRTNGRWKVLKQMQKNGDWPWVFSQIADRAIEGDPAGHYQQSLGC